MLLQWKDELEARIGLTFEILDKDHVNVFDCVYFEGKNRLHPLDELRRNLGGGFIPKL
jgi:hypothetical protein